MKFCLLPCSLYFPSSLFVRLGDQPCVTALFMKVEDVTKIKPKQSPLLVGSIFLDSCYDIRICRWTAMDRVSLIAICTLHFNVVSNFEPAIPLVPNRFSLVKMENDLWNILSYALAEKTLWRSLEETVLLLVLIYRLIVLFRAPQFYSFG